MMDPHKVDQIQNWKTPMNKALLLQFLGAAGYLADNCPNLHLKSAVLSTLTSVATMWHWGPTQHHAFEDVKDTIQKYRNLHWVAIDFNAKFDENPVSLMINASQTGGGRVILQRFSGKDNIVTFWSGKFNPA
jgi:hypothetical protein